MTPQHTKDYKAWTPVKAEVHNGEQRPIGYNEREIWLCSIGENIGFENDGKGSRFVRPVLILRKHSISTCHVVPLSTTPRRSRFHYPFDGDTGKISVALLSQSRTVDTSRLHRKIGEASASDFKEIKVRLRAVLRL